jgi:hypothetical protein
MPPCPTHVVVCVEAGIISSVEPFSSEDEAVERKAQLLRIHDPAEDDIGVFEMYGGDA